MQKIPSTFECAGMTVTVNITDAMSKKKHGDWDRKTQTIRIHKSNTTQLSRQTFWHEFTHAALDNLSYFELSKDEEFVDRFAQCLYQLEKTRA